MSKRKEKQSSIWMVRQGDVLIVRETEDSGALTELPREAGAVVLAHGEVTGHKHQIRDPGVCHLRSEGVHAYTVLRVDSDTVDLIHEEHSTISIPCGRYRVTIQQEYTPEEFRNVAD